MNVNEIVYRVKSLDLPKGSYVVFGSCPMAVAGLREAGDIDLLVSARVYKKLMKAGWRKVYKGPKDAPLTHDVFEAHDDWNFSSYNPALPELLQRATEVEGIQFASLDDVRKWKQASGRLKDLKDISLIDNYFKLD